MKPKLTQVLDRGITILLAKGTTGYWAMALDLRGERLEMAPEQEEQPDIEEALAMVCEQVLEAKDPSAAE
jgi:hypothetical protein